MSYPFGPPPEDAYVIGNYGEDMDRATAEAIMSGQAVGSWDKAHDEIKRRLKPLDDGVKGYEDGQLALSQRLDLLSPLQDYGSAYMNSNQGFDQTGQVNFTNQIGPMQNCSLKNGRIILGDSGLWDVRCQLWFDYIDVLTGVVEWHVRILRPDGSVFSKTRAYMDTQRPFSSTNICSVVVPEAGYQVQAWVQNIAAFRGLLGGPDRNRLTVQHISREVNTGDTGQ